MSAPYWFGIVAYAAIACVFFGISIHGEREIKLTDYLLSATWPAVLFIAIGYRLAERSK